MIPERLQAVDVIGVIVARDDVTDLLVGDLPDPLQQRPSETRRSQPVEHHDAVRGDEESGVGSIAFVVLAGNPGIAGAVIDRLARHLIDL